MKCKDIGLAPFSHECGDPQHLKWSKIMVYQEKPIEATPLDIQPYIADALCAVPGDVTRPNFEKAVRLVLKKWDWK